MGIFTDQVSLQWVNPVTLAAARDRVWAAYNQSEAAREDEEFLAALDDLILLCRGRDSLWKDVAAASG